MEDSTSAGLAWALLGLVAGAGAMYVLAKEDIYRPNPLTLPDDVIADLKGYGSVRKNGDEYRMTVPSGTDLEDIQACLPDGWRAGWSGQGVPHSDGRPYEDVYIELADDMFCE